MAQAYVKFQPCAKERAGSTKCSACRMIPPDRGNSALLTPELSTCDLPTLFGILEPRTYLSSAMDMTTPLTSMPTNRYPSLGTEIVRANMTTSILCSQLDKVRHKLTVLLMAQRIEWQCLNQEKVPGDREVRLEGTNALSGASFPQYSLCRWCQPEQSSGFVARRVPAYQSLN